MWVYVEEWFTDDLTPLEVDIDRIEVYKSLEAAENAWANRSNIRSSWEGWEVTPTDKEDYFDGDRLIKWYSLKITDTSSFVKTTIVKRLIIA